MTDQDDRSGGAVLVGGGAAGEFRCGDVIGDGGRDSATLEFAGDFVHSERKNI